MSAQTAEPWAVSPGRPHQFGNPLDAVNGYVGSAVRAADASFIVQACNAHDGLVAALERLDTVARNLSSCVRYGISPPVDDYERETDAALEQARAALRAAGGGQ